jgi:hypothetical protein
MEGFGKLVSLAERDREGYDVYDGMNLFICCRSDHATRCGLAGKDGRMTFMTRERSNIKPEIQKTSQDEPDIATRKLSLIMCASIFIYIHISEQLLMLTI